MAVPSELLQIILTKTQEGKLAWSELSSTGFTAFIKPNSITVDMDRGDYSLRIANQTGTLLEIVTEEGWQNGPVQAIYDVARRQALRVDETLRDIMRGLASL